MGTIAIIFTVAVVLAAIAVVLGIIKPFHK